MKRICFFSGDITNSGGTERVGTIIANELAKLKDKYTISFLSLVEKKSESFFYIDECIKRSKLYDKPVKGSTHYFQICSKLYKYISRNNIDILIDIDGILDMYSLVVKMFIKVKVISWEHFNFYQHPAVRYRKYTRALAGKYSDGIVTLTKEDMEYYKENLNIKVPITYIHNPVILSHDYDYNRESKILLSVGRLTYQKGFDMLIDVAYKVLNKHIDWKWIILGDGEDKEKLQEKINKLSLQDRVILEGNVSNISDYYKAAGIFVLTSRYEGLPMTLLESKEYKLPAVSFDIKTGPKECIIDNINGNLIREFDIDEMSFKLCNLMEDKSLREKYSSHALDNYDNFKLENVVNDWVKLLGSI